MTLAQFNALSVESARQELMRCCGCVRWVDALLRLRPFKNRDSLLSAAESAWNQCGAKEWREAFAHHPRIGGRDALRSKFAATRDWAAGEQAGAAAASEDVLDALAKGNADYEAKFGHIFIVCATGKSAATLLDLLKSRLPNDADAELRLAAGEQGKITKLRLEKLIP
ncbi:MAG: 2-oxo-4-hydroxy-4-carboxy-5-ureidoimidazoline decarboxylase [Elusimicrobia bacterium]|nr:2-oxo-4-hydroxy-4-carboxy-5-ureidoimidazoline decarboxylase [Elusimicrobiota bacterium]